jgi:hypothetical protein
MAFLTVLSFLAFVICIIMVIWSSSKKKNPTYWAIGIGISCLIMLVCATHQNTVSPQINVPESSVTIIYFDSSASQTPGVIDASYDELAKLASTNEIAYDTDYKGRVIQLSSLRVVSVQSTANPRVNLVSAGGKSFTLYFDSDDGLPQLTPGMLITVQGTSDGVYFSEPSFENNCVLVSAVQ